jgi:hypothetical protein
MVAQKLHHAWGVAAVAEIKPAEFIPGASDVCASAGDLGGERESDHTGEEMATVHLWVSLTYWSVTIRRAFEVRESKTLISDELQKPIEGIAREQNREPGEVLEEAVRAHAGVRRLERLAGKGEARARALGIREEDVQRLVDEVRRENRERATGTSHSTF